MIDKKVQDLLWLVLSKEDKKKIKKQYSIATNDRKWDDAFDAALEDTFGLKNLTSDMKEDEMLTIPRKTIQKIYGDNCVELRRECVSDSDKDCYKAVNEVLKTLFGSKCYLDEKSDTDDKSKIDEQKFYKGDEVCCNYKDYLVEDYRCDVIECCCGKDMNGYYYKLENRTGYVWEYDLIPYRLCSGSTCSKQEIDTTNLPHKNDFPSKNHLEHVQSLYAKEYDRYIKSNEKEDYIILNTDIPNYNITNSLKDKILNMFQNLGFESEDITFVKGVHGHICITLNLI